MASITIHPATADQKTAIRVFLDALKVDYKTDDEVDETEYLESSPKMVSRLEIARQQEKNGKWKTVSLDDIWK